MWRSRLARIYAGWLGRGAQERNAMNLLNEYIKEIFIDRPTFEPTPIDPKLARQKLDCIRAKENEGES